MPVGLMNRCGVSPESPNEVSVRPTSEDGQSAKVHSDLGVDFLSEAEQIRATATVEVPGSDLLADRLLRLGADSRREAHEQASRALGQAAPEGIAQEVEAGVLRVSSWATRVFAVRDLRLLGVQLETKGREPVGDQVPKGPGLSLSVAVDNDVVRITLERASRMFPGHPHVERIVGSPRGISPRGSHGTERDGLPSLRSSHLLHRYARIQAQWAKSPGSLSVIPRHHALNRFQLRSRTYFFRAHRIT